MKHSHPDSIHSAAASFAAESGPSIFSRFSRSYLAAPLLLLALSCGFCWKLTLTPNYTWIDDPDVVNMDVPRLQFQRSVWQSHEFPLWDPRSWCGQPFLGSFVGAAFPLNWPLFLTSRDRGQFSLKTLNWYFVMLHFFGALTAYWLCREMKASRLSSVLGGIAYTFGGFVGVCLWPEVLGGLIVAPLVFLFMARVLRGHREFSSAALAGMFLGLTWLSGHHEIPIYVSLAAACLWIYDLFCRPGRWQRWLALVSLFLVFLVFTSGFQVLPGYEYARLAVRWVGADHPLQWSERIPYRIDSQYSFQPAGLVSLAIAWSTPVHSEAFTGIVVLVLGLISFLNMWQERFVRVFGCLSPAGLLLALGNWNPLHGILYATVPFFETARAPLRILSIFQLGIIVLAALGADRVQQRAASTAFRSIWCSLVILGGAIFAMGIGAAVLAKPPLSSYAFVTALAALFFAALFAARQRGMVSAAVFIVASIGLVFFELGNGSGALYSDPVAPSRPTVLPELTRYSDIADFLRNQAAPVRVFTFSVSQDFNFGEWEGIDTLNGFGAGVTDNILSLDWPSVRGQNLLGVGYSLSKENSGRSDQTLVFRGQSGINVFKNADAFPRAWIVHQVDSAASVEQAQELLRNPSFDLRHVGVLRGRAPDLQPCAGNEDARISHRDANSVVVEAHLNCRGMLILSDTFYPGWSAQADGHRLPIYQTDLALRGVVLEPGSHRLEFHYRPASVLLGALMSVIGVLGACGLALWEWRQPRL